MLRIVVSDSKGAKSEYAVKSHAATLGRAEDNSVVLRGWTVGKRQATIELRGESIYVVDHGGLSATELNQKPIDKEAGPLGIGDIIGIAGYNIEVSKGAAVEATPTPAPASVSPLAAKLAAVPAAEPAARSVVDAHSQTTTLDLRAAIAGLPTMEAPVAPKPVVAAPAPVPAAPTSAPAAAPIKPPPAPMSTELADVMTHWRAVIYEKLISTMDLRRIDVSRMNEDQLRAATAAIVNEIIAAESGVPGAVDKVRLGKEVLDEAVGLGPLEELLADPAVTEIMVNRYDQIYIERGGKLTRSPVVFTSEKGVVSAIERIVAPLGRRIDESSPMVDARLKDGSRVNAVIPPLALKGANITIRKFSKNKLHDTDLIKFGSVTKEIMAFMQQAVHHAANIVISGGTGSGKTTLLNVLSNYIPEDDRIITVEDAAELQLGQPHVVSLESRPPNVEGKGAVPIRDLVKNCLRMRPDRIVVGECRGGEALDMLQAMNTGHDGSMTTAHANTPRDCIARLEVMTLMSGLDLPIRAIREQISSAVHIIIQQSRFPDGSRRVTHVTEVTGMEGEMIQLQDIFLFKMEGYGADGRIRGKFFATGAIPELYQSLTERGIPVDLSIFQKDKTL
ncbi:MAG: Flp pilus assembly complex ATPase component TadA [Rhodoferax sp.]|nr:Flp pilus assembly complex ATPase component TadA [Rhodoferax sp.]